MRITKSIKELVRQPSFKGPFLTLAAIIVSTGVCGQEPDSPMRSQKHYDASCAEQMVSRKWGYTLPQGGQQPVDLWAQIDGAHTRIPITLRPNEAIIVVPYLDNQGLLASASHTLRLGDTVEWATDRSITTVTLSPAPAGNELVLWFEVVCET